MQRLLRGAALAIHRNAGNMLRQPRGEHRAARDVLRLLAGLNDAAHDDVFDQRRVRTRAGDEIVEHDAGEIGGMPAADAAVAFAARRAGRCDDIGLTHAELLPDAAPRPLAAPC